jgi:Fic family protein
MKYQYLQERESVRLATIDALKMELDVLRSALDNARIREALRVEFLWESNRIEGNTLTLRETHLVVNEGMTISGKSMREHLEAINHKEAVLFVEDIVSKKIDFSETVLKQIHALVMHGTDENRMNTGVYRTVPVLISGSKHIPPAPVLVSDLMQEYFEMIANSMDASNSASLLHPVILSAILHERLVTIHPFTDGNGRTARLVMNMLLLRHGFPLVILGGDGESRSAYYDALEKVQVNEDSSAFVAFMCDNVEQNLRRYITIFQAS